jgi:hypothetical protein
MIHANHLILSPICQFSLQWLVALIVCRAPTLGSTVHHVSVPRSVADTHRASKIDIKNHTFIDNGKTYYIVHITQLGLLVL